jgi:pentatricopeptide repeat protein
MKKLLIILSLCLLIVPSGSSGKDEYEEQLNRGIRNDEPYAYLLIQQSKTDGALTKSILKEALRSAPDLPAVYFELSKANFTLNANGLFKSFDYLRQGIEAYERDFWWLFMTVASLFTSLILSFFVSIFILVVIRLPKDMPLFSHDMKETSTRIFLLLVFVFALFGPLYFLGSLLMLVSFYAKKWDRLVLYLYILFLLAAPWTFNLFSLFFNAATSGDFKAIVQVNESRGNTYAATALQNRDKPAELFSYALALKREGRYHEAIATYDKLMNRKPAPRTYNNLANCYVALGELEKAKELYIKSNSLEPLPSVRYNLSQVHREMLEFDKGDEYFLAAQSLDREAVSRYRAIAGRNPNRFVIDERLTLYDFLQYAKEKATSVSTMGLSILPPLFIPVIAVCMAVFFFISDRRFKTWSYRCKRCGKILCSKCERHILWGHMCLQCYRSLIKLVDLDAKERIARLLTVYEFQKKKRSRIKIFSSLLPGSGQIYAGNLLQGLFFLWPFLFFLFVPVLNTVFHTEMSSFSHFWMNLISFLCMVIMYIFSNLITRRRIAKGWL